MRNWWNANKVYSLVNNTAPILTSSLGSLYYGYTRLYIKGRRVNAILQLTVICNVQITKIISNLKVKKSDIQQMQSAQYSCFPIWTFNYKETFFKTTCVCVCVCVCVSVCIHSSRVGLFATPWTVALQTPLSMGFPRQEYWSGLLVPTPGYLPDKLENSKMNSILDILNFVGTIIALRT